MIRLNIMLLKLLLLLRWYNGRHDILYRID